MTSDLRFHEHDRDASGKPERGSIRRRCAAAAAWVVLAMCPACAGYQADPLVPAAELRKLIQRGETAVSRELPPSLVGSTWFPITEDIDLGDGLTLQEANALSLFYAPALVAARTRHRVAAAQLLSAGLLPNPELFIAPRLSTSDSQLVMPAALLFEIPLGGELSAEEDAARAKLDSAQWRVMQAELEMLESVRLMFLRIAALREQRARQESLRVEAQRIVAWVEQLSAAGEVDLLTLQLARLEREDVIASIQRQDIELARATTELVGMIGLHPRARVEPVAPASLLSAVELPAPDDSAVLRHPRLRAQESAYLEAEGLLRLEVARQYPSLRIGPDLEYDRGDLLLGVGLALPIPLFDQNQGQIAEAIEMRQAAREQ